MNNLYNFNEYVNLVLEAEGSIAPDVESLLVQAIKDKKVVNIKYSDGKPVLRGIRNIEPHAFGLATSGNKLLRAWLREGVSKTGRSGESPMPGWRLFRLDRIRSVEITDEDFKTRPGYNSKDTRIVEFDAKLRNSRKKLS